MTTPSMTIQRPRLYRRAMLGVIAVMVLSSCGAFTTDDDGGGQVPAGGAPQTSEPASAPPPATEPSSPEPEPTPTEEPEPERASDPSWDADSISVLVNKQNPLDPPDYEPEDLRELEVPMHYPDQRLRAEPADALEELFEAATDEGHHLAVTTAYRDYDHQLALYDNWYWERGQEATDAMSARPGYSEHQTGLAVDILTASDHPDELLESFGDTPEGIWVAENAHEFGYLVRYPEGAEEITGYQYEPWHLRYVGVETAAEVYDVDVTLEEYWEQPAAPDYEYDYLEDPSIPRD